MHRAAEGGHLQVLQYLLAKGAEVDSQDKVSNHTCALAMPLPSSIMHAQLIMQAYITALYLYLYSPLLLIQQSFFIDKSYV